MQYGRMGSDSVRNERVRGDPAQNGRMRKRMDGRHQPPEGVPGAACGGARLPEQADKPGR